MPTPRTPPFVDELVAKLDAIELAITNMEAAIVAQSEDLERVANYQRLSYENMYGADTSSSGIWDGTDRYPEV